MRVLVTGAGGFVGRHLVRELDGAGYDILATDSSRGPSRDFVMKPDIVAPGNRLISTLAPGATVGDIYPERVTSRHQIELSGTSMATGVVSGAAWRCGCSR